MTMTRAPHVSVVVPVYNRGATIGEAIESLRRQTLTDIEIVVVDDGSTDDTAAKVRAIGDSRIRLVQMGRNTGIPTARNRGTTAAQGEYVALLDSDDTAMPDRLALQAAFLDRHPACAFVGSLSEEMRADGTPTGKIKRRPILPDDMRAHALFRCPVLQSTVMARRAVLAAYPYDSGYPVCSDYHMFARLTWDHAAATLPYVLVRRRVHDGSISREKFHVTRDLNKAIIRQRLATIGLLVRDSDVDNHYSISHLNKTGVTVDAALLTWARQWFPSLREKAMTAGIAASAIDAMIGALWVKACVRTKRWTAVLTPPLSVAVIAAAHGNVLWRPGYGAAARLDRLV